MKQLFLLLFIITLFALTAFSTTEIVFCTDLTPLEAEALINENIENEHFVIPLTFEIAFGPVDFITPLCRSGRG